MTQPTTYYLNPFRFRGYNGNDVYLGAGPELKVLRNQPHLRALLDQPSVSPQDLDGLAPALVAHLMKGNFLTTTPIEQTSRVSRQLGFFSCATPDASAAQAALERAHVTVLGAGGVGSQVAYLLASSGVRTLTLVDHDVVEESNLNRQMLYVQDDIGHLKVERATLRLRAMFPDLDVHSVNRRLDTPEDMMDVMQGTDLVIRAVDTPFDVSYVIDEACHHLQIPHLGGGFNEVWAVAGPFIDPRAVRLAQVLPQTGVVPATIRKGATFGPLTFWLSSQLASDAVRYLSGLGTPVTHSALILMNGLTGQTFASRPLDKELAHAQ